MLGSVSPLLVIANVCAVVALTLMMFGVGLAVGERLPTLHRQLERSDVVGQLVSNLLVLPGLSALLLARVGAPVEVTIAILLLACLPAGPISLLFVGQGERELSRATALVLLLQTASVVASPLLLFGLGELVVGRPIVAVPRTAALSMGAQILLLETLPIVAGAVARVRYPALAARLRRPLRTATMLLLASAGVFFSSLYLGSLGSLVSVALGLSLALLSMAWVSTAAVGARSSWHDFAQVAALRNISLSIVVAGTTPGLEGSVLFVLIGAFVLSVAAPSLRALMARLPSRAPPDDAVRSAP